MKKYLTILMILAMLLTGCDVFRTAPEVPPETESKEEVPTGYPSGQMQREYLYYNGVVWVYDTSGFNSTDKRVSELPEGATYVGEVLFEDPYEIPDEDFHSAHIKVGRKIYISAEEDTLYIEYRGEKTVFYRYVPSDEE